MLVTMSTTWSCRSRKAPRRGSDDMKYMEGGGQKSEACKVTGNRLSSALSGSMRTKQIRRQRRDVCEVQRRCRGIPC